MLISLWKKLTQLSFNTEMNTCSSPYQERDFHNTSTNSCTNRLVYMQCVNNVYCEHFGKNLNYISYYYLKFFRNDKAHTCTYIHILYIVYHTWLGVNDPLFVNHEHQHLWCIDDTKTLWSYKSWRTHIHTLIHTHQYTHPIPYWALTVFAIENFTEKLIQ